MHHEDTMVTLAGIAAAVAVVTWLHYLRLIPREKVPARPVLHSAGMVGAMAASAAALTSPHSGWVELALAALMTWPLAGGFLLLLTQARLPAGEAAVSLGDPLLPFSAPTHTGATWSTEELAGRRVLLKFFRGHW